MTTAKRTKQQAPRLCRLHHLPSGLVLGITANNDTVFYGLKPLDNGFGEAAFRLTKAERGGVAGEVYDVLIDGDRSTCECLGFLRHKHCKHLECLETLVAAGKLPACRKATPAPVMTNVEEPMAAVLLGGERHRQEMAAPKPPAEKPAVKKPWCERCNDDPAVYCSHCSL
jgi:hypothetical protein